MKLTQQLLRFSAPTLLALASLATPSVAQIQAEPTVMNVNIRVDVNKFGDAEMTLTSKMNASEWADWKDRYGNNPSLFKRDMSKMFSAYELADFKLEQDDMNRQAVVTILGKGVSTYEGDGVFEFELEENMTDGELIDGEYRVTYTEAQGPSAITLYDQRLQTPEGAKNIKVTTGSAGKTVLRYELPVESEGLPWLKIGMLLSLIGGGLCFFGRDNQRGAYSTNQATAQPSSNEADGPEEQTA